MHWLIILSLISVSQAGRKSDTIRRLILEKRFSDAQKRCGKWKAKESNSNPELREYCAQADWPLVEKENTVRAWQKYQSIWVGTNWAERGFEREGSVSLAELGDSASEQVYLDLYERFKGYVVGKKILKAAAGAALEAVADETDARRIVDQYAEVISFREVARKYPAVFVTMDINTDEKKAVVTVDDRLSGVEVSEPRWVGRHPDGKVQSWDTVVKKYLENAGIPSSNIMKVIQEHREQKTPGTAFPICSMGSMPAELEAGVEVLIDGISAVKTAPWESSCSNDGTAVLVYRNKSLFHFSTGPNHHLQLGPKNTKHANFTHFVAPGGVAVLFEQRLHVPVGNSFAIFPLDGGVPWLGDKPPGQMRVVMNNTIRGTGNPIGWSLGVKDGKVAVNAAATEGWTVPMEGEIRFLSPTAMQLLGLSALQIQAPTAPQLAWSDPNDKAAIPTGATQIPLQKLADQSILQLRYHLGSTSILPERVEVIDAYALNLDADSGVERIVRAKVDGHEVVLVLDKDESLGHRTFIYRTNHAIHGNVAAPAPVAFQLGEQRYFSWAGQEDSTQYRETIYGDLGGFVIME